MKYIIGIDLGGTKIKGALLTTGLKVIRACEVATEARKGKAEVLGNLFNLIEILWRPGVAGIGIGTPGDVRGGIVRKAMNIKGWDKINLQQIVTRRFKVPVRVGNDADCFALGVQHYLRCKHIICITLGTGVGSGVITDGKLLRGWGGATSELGHTVINFNGPRCSCGKRGCLEAYVSGRAISQQYYDLTGRRKEAKEIASLTTKDARLVMKNTGTLLGVGLANIVDSFNPEYIIIGGSVAQAEGIYAPARAAMRTWAFSPDAAKIKVIKNRWKDASVVGPGRLVIDKTAS